MTDIERLRREPEDFDDYEYDDDDGGDCHWCGGEGWVDHCPDPINCDCDGRGVHRCGSCGGSGRAEDMTVW